MIQIKLSPSQIKDFKIISELTVDLLHAVGTNLSALQEVPLAPTALLDEIKKSFPKDEKSAESLMRQGLALNGLLKQTGADAEGLLKSIRDSLETEANWPDEQIAKWSKVEHALIDLLNTRTFRIVANSIDLSYDYEKLYRKARILTDIRPLFTENADDVEGAVVSFTLRLHYGTRNENSELSVCLDRADVEELASQCDRALKKANTSLRLVKEKLEIPVIITGVQNAR